MRPNIANGSPLTARWAYINSTARAIALGSRELLCRFVRTRAHFIYLLEFGSGVLNSEVSTAGVTGCLLRRAAFFTGARLNLALATVVAFPRAAFDGLRALRRAVAPVLFCTFDAFLRLAVMDTPGLVCAPQRTQVGHPHPVKHRQVHGQATWTWLRRKVRQVWDGARTSRPWIWLAKDAPTQRTVQRSGSIVTMPILSGLHHRYARI